MAREKSQISRKIRTIAPASAATSRWRAPAPTRMGDRLPLREHRALAILCGHPPSGVPSSVVLLERAGPLLDHPYRREYADTECLRESVERKACGGT